MELLILFGAALAVAPFVLVAELALSLWRPTRYFAIPLVGGAIVGLIVTVSSGHATYVSFFLGFMLFALPVGAICAVMAILTAIGWVAAREEAVQKSRQGDHLGGHGSREPTPVVLKFLLAGAALVALGMIANALNGPVGTPTELRAVVHNQSGRYLGNGETKFYLDVELEDRRQVTATGCGPVTSSFFGDVVVEEYRRRLTRSPVYLIPQMTCDGKE